MNIIKKQDKTFNVIYLNFQLIRYLPRKYDGIVKRILRWSEDEFKFDKIVLELVAEETPLTVRDQYNAKFSPSVNNFKVKPRRFKQKRCWHCGLPGHLRNKCRKFLNTRFYQRSPSSGADSTTNSGDSTGLSPATPRSRNLELNQRACRDQSTDSAEYPRHSRGTTPYTRSPSSRPFRETRSPRRAAISRQRHGQ